MVKQKPNSRYEVLTPRGWKSFDGIRVLRKDSFVSIKTDKGSLRASENHRIRANNKWVSVSDLSIDDELDCLGGVARVLSVETTNSPIDLYDLLEVDDGYQYYSNGFVSHNCQFLGSQETLIKASKIASLAFQTPIMENEDGLAVYEHPVPGNIYTACVDTCRAVGLDYHAVTIVDVTSIPYKVVAKYRNNTLPIPILPNLIKSLLTKYNEAYVLIEINDGGQQVADILRDELEYENIIDITIKGHKGQRVGTGFGGQRLYGGIKMSTQVKRIGCATLKEMIESDKLILNDFDIIAEISTYISKGNSFEASEGYHDDLIATLVIFCWLTTQNFFREMVSLDVRRKVFEEKLKKLEEELTPFGFVSSDIDDEMEEAVRMLANEQERQKPSKKDRSWMSDADEIL